MTDRSVAHATFVIERTYDAPSTRVFAAWSRPTAKARWFAGSEDALGDTYELDFRVGGSEVSRGGPPGGPVFTFRAHIHEIVPDERIVYSYDMYLDETCISASVTTVEFRPEKVGTRLTFTEQGAFLDGADTPAEREEGTGGLLDRLGEALSSTTADSR
jgi:uncharacterized protein YndB with AHSA1/START domain